MGAWKLRALVYGLLAVVAALVLVARGEQEGTANVPPADRFGGRTVHGAEIEVFVRRDRLVSFRVGRVELLCWNGTRRTWQWGVTPSGPGTTYTRWRDGFTVHSREPSFDVWVHARFGASGRRLTGRFQISERYRGGTCESGRVGWSASR